MSKKEQPKPPPDWAAGAVREFRRIIFIKKVSAVLIVLIVCVAIVACVQIIADAIVKLADKKWWEILIPAAVTMLIAPSGLFWLMDRRIKRYTQHTQPRIAEAERMLDPQRTSSQLRTDGSNRPEDLV